MEAALSRCDATGAPIAMAAVVKMLAATKVLAVVLVWSLGGCSDDGSSTDDATSGAGAGATSGGNGNTASAGVSNSGTGGATAGSGGDGGAGGNGSGGGPVVPGEVLFFDDFEYDVLPTNDPGNLAAFQAAGWGGAKAINVSGSHGGNLYTTATIEGYDGAFPGVASTRALCINSLAGTLATQTDFYLQYGDEQAPPDTVPGNVWLQFWIYPNRSGSEQTGYHSREKFIYPCDGPYPCNSGKWIWLLASSSYEPFNEAAGAGDAFIVSRDNQVGTVSYSLAAPENVSKLGQTDTSELIAPNRWTLVKIHYDTSTPNGTYEAWVRPLGGSFIKVAEWIHGTTPSFSWDIPPENVGGHRVLRMPTTMPANAVTGTEDAWLYMDDFAIATAESALPTYP
jgi:hypothetical protein